MRRIALIFVGVFLVAAMLSVGSSFAQQQQMPNYVLHAAQTLNSQYGANIDVNNVIWEFVDYGVDLAGAKGICPQQAQSAPALNNTRVYWVEFQPVRNGVWGDEIWQVLVYGDLSYVGICSAPIPAAATPIPGTPLPTNTPSQCGTMPSRLVIGQEGRVTGDSPNNLRAQAGTSAQYVGEIPVGAIFFVLDGPRCTADGAWWYVNYNGTAGWTIEGQSGTYYLEPTSLINTQPTALPTVAPLSAPVVAPVCNPAMPSRMIVGALGRVTPGIPNNVRSAAGSSAQYLGEIPAEGVFRVLAGPSCAASVAWWQVDYNGMIGWTAEGTDGDYWIEPQFAAIPPLSSENIGTIRQYASFTLANAAILQFSPNNLLFGAVDSTLVRHQASNGFAVPASLGWQENPIVASQTPILAMQALGDTVQWLATREANGISVKYSADGSTYQERYLVNLVARSAAFSPDGRYLMLVDSSNAIQAFDTSVGQVLAILPNDTGEGVRQIAFSPDGRVFAAGFATGFVFWQVNNWAILGSAFFESPQNFQALALNNTDIAFSIATTQEALTFVVPYGDFDSWATDGIIVSHSTASHIVLAPDSSFLILATDYGIEYSALPGTEPFAERLDPSNQRNVSQLSLSPDGRFLAIATDTELQLWAVTVP